MSLLDEEPIMLLPAAAAAATTAVSNDIVLTVIQIPSFNIKDIWDILKHFETL